VFAANLNIFEEKLPIIKRNTGAISVASKENGVEVNAVNFTYVVMSGDKNSKRSHNVKCDNVSFERAKKFKILVMMLKS
jgi:hypothetical protein